jgi:acyl-ACP thioesterase
MAGRKKALFSSVCQTVLIDGETLRPVRIKEHVPHIPAEEHISKTPVLPITPLTRLDQELDKPVMYDYIDFNHHVNNAAYVVFARQTIPPSFYERNDLTQVKIAYQSPVTLGDTMVVQTQRDGQESIHRIVSKSDKTKEFARIQMFWRERE